MPYQPFYRLFITPVLPFDGTSSGRLHVRYKTGAWARGFIPSPYMRKPMPAPRKSEVAELVRLFRNLGLSVLDDPAIEAVVGQLAG